MAKIFVSHSQYDKDIRTKFDTAFARVENVAARCMEFERIYPPAWQMIRDEIRGSEAVFLLLGPNIRGSIHTQNWVAFEVGLACAFARDVWVFEQQNANVEFPVPYLTDYVICDLINEDHFNYVREIIQGYGKMLPLLMFNVDARTYRGIPHGKPVVCRYPDCMSNFSMHTDAQSFYCPSCRQPLP
jgi:hypothetical protein